MRVLVLCAAALAAGAWTSSASALEVFAHRGGAVVKGVPVFAENTLPAFRWTARSGTALEFDVRLTLDRVPIVIHDDTYNRTTTCAGAVTARPWGSVRRRCRAEWAAAGRTLAVPTLAQVLAVAERYRVPAMPEIKGDQDAQVVTDAIRASGIPQRLIIIQSFSPHALDVARLRWPGVATALLASRGDRIAARERATHRFTYVAPRWPVGPSYVRRAHARGLRVLPYGVDSLRAVLGAVFASVDAFITDDPTAARTLLIAGGHRRTS